MTIRLFLTVSGGLEELAEKQIRSIFDDESSSTTIEKLDWKRGPSGSQLYLSLLSASGDDDHGNDLSRQIATSINHFDFVEYVSAELKSLDDDNLLKITYDESTSDGNIGDLLNQLEYKSSRISKDSIDFSKKTCESVINNDCETRNLDNHHPDVGLDGLPGILIPTPAAIIPPVPHTKPATTRQDFAVNTIYTQPSVAEYVVETVFGFYKKTHFCNPENQNRISTLWIDAGAGDGSLLNHVPPDVMSLGVDTNPQSSRVLQQDYLKLSRQWLKNEFTSLQSICVISNPPFTVSSRGDYTPIVQFINHTFDNLQADIMAVICPRKFARGRIWKSLDMTNNACLLGRFFLPKNSFFNPSTGKPVHVDSYCLIFGKSTYNDYKINKDIPTTTIETKIATSGGVYLFAKRNKGCFPNLSTAHLTKAIAQGLTKAGSLELVAERDARYILNAKLVADNSYSSPVLEFWWQLNPQRPCSLINSNCLQVPNHSLGWTSLSCKPPVALAMVLLALDDNDAKDAKTKECRRKDSLCVIVNLMSGEGTIELEAERAFSAPQHHSGFMISGDKSLNRTLKSKQRVQSLKNKSRGNCLIEFVVWDAQRLPFRKGTADAVLADLPFQGSNKNIHQEAVVGTAKSTLNNQESSLRYADVCDNAARILHPGGRAALLSGDFKALRHAAGGFNWTPLLGFSGQNVDLGGMPGKLFLMERQDSCTKDLSLWVSSSSKNLSSWIFNLARKACDNDKQVAVSRDNHEDVSLAGVNSRVTKVELLSTFFHKEKQSLSHCYRIWFDDKIRNVQAKQLEQKIREAIESHLLEGMRLR